MRRFGRLLGLGLSLCFVIGGGGLFADQVPVLLDGRVDEWVGIAVTTDAIGDAGSSGIDLASLSLADDDDFLYVRFDVTSELLLNDGHSLVVYVDADDNASTGKSVAGIGAELEWRLGDRRGDLWSSGSPTEIFHEDILFRGAPAVTATEFELAIGRSTPMLSLGSNVRVVVRDEDGSGDRIPNGGSGVAHALSTGGLPSESDLPLDRELSTDVRVVSFNVLSDAPWEGAGNRIGRLIAAVSADIYGFQEIYQHDAAETLAYVQAWVAPPSGSDWHVAENGDCRVVSRYPILDQWSLSGNLAVWLDTVGPWGSPCLLVNAHLPCCANNSGRQEEVDEIVAFIGDQKASGVLAANPTAPIIILGDMNFVGDAQQVTTLLTGDIVDEGQWGGDVVLDSDGTALRDAHPRQVARRMTYTWRNDSSSFWPGRLDYLAYSDSVLEAGRAFAIYTPELSAATLSSHGLQANDSSGSDHLPIVVDLRPVGSAGIPFRRGDCNGDGGVNLIDAVRTLAVVFGAVASSCPDACDFDDGGVLDIADAVGILDTLFAGGPGPFPPLACGTDPTDDGLSDCTAFVGCP